MELRGKRVLVTGANRGIGRALATELVHRGATVLAGVRDVDGFDPIQGAKPVKVDLGSRETIGDALEHEIDVLINNAGQYEGGKLEDQDTDAIYSMLQVNLVGLMHLTKLVVPAMVRRGSGMVVNNASISGYVFFPGATTYAASKAGVVGFSEALRRELRGTGVGVLHLVTPGVETDMLAATRKSYEGHSDISSWRQVSPEDWARTVADAIEKGKHVQGPGIILGAGKLLSRGPAFLLDLPARRFFKR